MRQAARRLFRQVVTRHGLQKMGRVVTKGVLRGQDPTKPIGGSVTRRRAATASGLDNRHVPITLEGLMAVGSCGRQQGRDG